MKSGKSFFSNIGTQDITQGPGTSRSGQCIANLEILDMREAMKNSFNLKAGVLLTTAFGVFWSPEHRGCDPCRRCSPAGFKKGD